MPTVQRLSPSQRDLAKFQATPAKNSGVDAADGDVGGVPLPRFDDALKAARKPATAGKQDAPAGDAGEKPEAESQTQTETQAQGHGNSEHETPGAVGRARRPEKGQKKGLQKHSQDGAAGRAADDSDAVVTPQAGQQTAVVTTSEDAATADGGDTTSDGAKAAGADANATAAVQQVISAVTPSVDQAVAAAQSVVVAQGTPVPATTPASTSLSCGNDTAVGANAARPSLASQATPTLPGQQTQSTQMNQGASGSASTVPTQPAGKSDEAASEAIAASAAEEEADAAAASGEARQASRSSEKKVVENTGSDAPQVAKSSAPAVQAQPLQSQQQGDNQQQNGAANREKTPAFSIGKHVVKSEGAGTSETGNSNTAVQPQAASVGTPQALQDLIVEAVKDVAGAGGASAPAEDKPVTASPVALIPPMVTTSSGSTESAEVAVAAQQLPPETNDSTYEQVVLGLRGKLDARNGKAEIRLDPPNLGTLHVSLSLSNGSLTAEFQSSSDVVRDLLKSNMEKLKSVLEGQGVAVDKLAVESPAAAPGAQSAKTADAGSPNHDGRSAGNFGRDSNSGQRRSPESGSPMFSRMFQRSRRAASEPPIDVVA